MKIERTTRRLALAAALAAIAFAAPVAAQAQSSTPPLSVDEIRFCMCQQQQIDATRPELDALRAMVNERQMSLAQREGDIEAFRVTVSPDDLAAQEQIKRMIYESNQIRDMLRRDLTPSYYALSRVFNETVAVYNEHCANRRMVAIDVNAAKSNLTCVVMQQ